MVTSESTARGESGAIVFTDTKKSTFGTVDFHLDEFQSPGGDVILVRPTVG